MTKPAKTTFSDARAGKCEMRYATTISQHSEMGKSGVTLECPFCEAHVVAYYWSLAGSGKRCSCGAIIGGTGATWKLKDPAQAEGGAK